MMHQATDWCQPFDAIRTTKNIFPYVIQQLMTFNTCQNVLHLFGNMRRGEHETIGRWTIKLPRMSVFYLEHSTTYDLFCEADNWANTIRNSNKELGQSSGGFKETSLHVCWSMLCSDLPKSDLKLSTLRVSIKYVSSKRDSLSIHLDDFRRT